MSALTFGHSESPHSGSFANVQTHHASKTKIHVTNMHGTNTRTDPKYLKSSLSYQGISSPCSDVAHRRDVASRPARRLDS